MRHGVTVRMNERELIALIDALGPGHEMFDKIVKALIKLRREALERYGETTR